jgi:hypothetical protein
MNEKIKKFFQTVWSIIKTVFFVIGILATAGGLFFLGRNLNRRRIQPGNDGAGEIAKGVDGIGESNSRIKAGLEKLGSSISDAKAGLGNAIEILRKAKKRSMD